MKCAIWINLTWLDLLDVCFVRRVVLPEVCKKIFLAFLFNFEIRGCVWSICDRKYDETQKKPGCLARLGERTPLGPAYPPKKKTFHIGGFIFESWGLNSWVLHLLSGRLTSWLFLYVWFACLICFVFPLFYKKKTAVVFKWSARSAIDPFKKNPLFGRPQDRGQQFCHWSGLLKSAWTPSHRWFIVGCCCFGSVVILLRWIWMTPGCSQKYLNLWVNLQEMTLIPHCFALFQLGVNLINNCEQGIEY